MLAQRHPEVREIAAQVQVLSFSERHRMMADAREKWRRDQRAYLSEAIESGLSQDLERGREEGLSKGSAEREQLRQENQETKMENELLREEIARLKKTNSE